MRVVFGDASRMHLQQPGLRLSMTLIRDFPLETSGQR